MVKTPRPLLLTVREVSGLLRIHRPKVYDLIKSGVIEGFKLGADWRVRRESLERMIGPIPDEFFAGKGEVPAEDDEEDHSIRANESATLKVV